MKQSNEILDKICAVLNTSSMISTTQSMERCGHHTISIKVDPNLFSTELQNYIEQIALLICGKAYSVFNNIYPFKYKSANTMQQLGMFVNVYCSKYEYMSLHPELLASLSADIDFNETYRNIVDNKIFTNTELITLPQFANKGRIILSNEKITIDFQSFQFIENQMTVTFSIDFPKDRIVIDLCKA